MSAVNDVFTYLTAQGIAGGSTEWDLKRRRLMDAPATDQLVVLTEDGGRAPEIAETEGIGDSALQDVGVHVLVRAEAWDGDASAAKAQEVLDALHGRRDVQLDQTTYLRVRALTPEPVFLGFDEQGRPRHTVALRLLTELPFVS